LGEVEPMPSRRDISALLSRPLPTYPRAAVIATRGDGVVIYWNAAAERLYGWRASEAIGRNIVDLTPAPHTRDKSTEIMAFLQVGLTWMGHIVLRRRNGLPVAAFVMDFPVGDLGHGRGGVIGVSVPKAQTRLIIGDAPRIGRHIQGWLRRDRPGRAIRAQRTPRGLEQEVMPRAPTGLDRYAPPGPTMRIASLHRRGAEPASEPWRVMQRIETYRHWAEHCRRRAAIGQFGSDYLAQMWLRLAAELHVRAKRGQSSVAVLRPGRARPSRASPASA
jgi:PAS domain S-box-containing protein